MECSIQRGEAKNNPDMWDNASQVEVKFHRMKIDARMKNIHYLFYITSTIICCHLEQSINNNILENAPFQVKGHRSVPFNAILYYCMVLSFLCHVTLYHPIK